MNSLLGDWLARALSGTRPNGKDLTSCSDSLHYVLRIYESVFALASRAGKALSGRSGPLPYECQFFRMNR